MSTDKDCGMQESMRTPPPLKKTVVVEQTSCDDMQEQVSEGNKKHPKKDDSSWIGGLFVLVLVGAAIWALVHFNPSEEAHRDALEEVVSEQFVDDFYSGNDNAMINALGASAQLKKLKYKSIGVCSWTYVKKRGRYELGSIGACGMVFTLVK